VSVRLTLDVGCADGAAIGYRYSGNGRCVGVDFDPALVARARQAGIPDADFLVASAEALPFASGLFDTVGCEHVAEHVADLGATLDELARVLKPGGTLRLSFPHFRAERVIARLYPAYFSERFHRRIIEPERLRRALARRGLRTLSIGRNQSFRALKNIYKFATGHEVEDQTGRAKSSSPVLKALEALWVALEFTPAQIEWHLRKRGQERLAPAIRAARVLTWPLRPVFWALDRVLPANVDLVAVKEGPTP